MAIPDSAFFVMPRDGRQWRNAVGLWVTVAGWAAAATRRFGTGWIVTPGEVVDAAGALSFTEPSEAGAPSRASHLPVTAITAVKDARQALRAERFRRAAVPDELGHQHPAFVWQHHDLFARAGGAIARDFGVPLVAYVHAPQVWEAESWGVHRPGWGHLVERFGEQPALCESDVVACVSRDVATELHRFGVDATRVVVSPMAVDAERFRPDPAAGAAVRRALGLGDGPVVGWAGTFRGFHGLEDLVDAFRTVASEDDRARLLLVGTGPARDDVAARVRRVGIEDRVVFAGGVAHLDVPRQNAAMDVAVASANLQSGFHYSPQKLREYLACGRATVAPAVGEVPDAVTDGKHALLYEPGNVESLTAKVSELLASPDARERLGRDGREHVLATATWDIRLRDLLASPAFVAATRAHER